jgi:glutamyl-tRNA synthetase
MLVGRLAPSPTGRLHLGHARSFLLAWWSARSQGGKVLLRLEDLDNERAAQAHVDGCLFDLEWLGLDWDERPRLQSDGFDRIRAAALALEQRGLAYPCRCTRADLRAAVNAPQQGTTELRYTGRCRTATPELATRDTPHDSGAALRFRVPPGDVHFCDELWGQQRFDVQAEVGDFLILRRDQIPSYQLAVTVDDAVDGVTEVVRGDDLLPSTARQLLLAQALGLQEKRYYHVPLVVDAQGRRLAKRCDDLGIATLREAGIDPRSVVGWVARHSGMPGVERATAQELLSSFAWRRLPLTPVTLRATALTDGSFAK